MPTKCTVMFPYGGYRKSSERERVFWKIIDAARKVDNEPIVVLNRDTEMRALAADYLADPRSQAVETRRAWSVDTCQMWLAGWGHVLDDHADSDRVVLLPGDIDEVRDEKRFFSNLELFILQNQPDMLIGDFTSESRYSSKELIDTYGTYPLLANWFDEVSRAIRSLPLSKPRSEFLNINTSVLRELLAHRKFAYEQTVNMLIRAWDFGKDRWRYTVLAPLLGELHDDNEFRQYRTSLDQIERTERLLRLLWREIREPKPTGNSALDAKNYKKFVDEYHMTDQQSSNIRDSARVTIRTLLGT